MSKVHRTTGGALPVDANNQPIQQLSVTTFKDGNSAARRYSPMSVSNVIKSCTIPDNAIRLFVYSKGADLRIGTNTTLSSAPTNSGHACYIIASNTGQEFYVAGMTSLYFLRNGSVSPTARFFFTTL